MANIMLETEPVRNPQCWSYFRKSCRMECNVFLVRSSDLLVVARGPPHEGHHLHGKVNAELHVDGHCTSVTYKQLADALRSTDTKVAESLDDVSDETLYDRVWAWCKGEARELSVF